MATKSVQGPPLTLELCNANTPEIHVLAHNNTSGTHEMLVIPGGEMDATEKPGKHWTIEFPLIDSEWATVWYTIQ